MVDRIDRCTKVFLIIIVDQLYRHLRICLRIKRIAIADQLILQFLIILDDTVVYSHDIPVITDMRMCIILRRLPMCRPARVTDTTGPGHCRPVIRLLCEHLQASLRLNDRRRCTAIAYRQSG